MGLLRRTAWRRDLPIATARGHRCGVRLALDLGRPGKAARSRPGPPVCLVMSAPADVRLKRLLGADHLASLRKRLRRRFERAPVDKPIDHIRIGGLAAEEHAALASLIGRPQRYSGSMQIDVSLVDAALQRSGIASSLCDALER